MIPSRALLSLAAGLSLLAGGCVTVETPTREAEPTASPPATATVPPSPTPTPAPTSAPTITPMVAPTPTATPQPSPTPTSPMVSFESTTLSYENATFGVRFSYPEKWEKAEREQLGDPLVTVSGPGQSPLIRLFLEFPSEETTPAQMARRDLVSLEGVLEGLTVLSEEETSLQDGTPAYDLVIKGGAPTLFEVRLLYTVRGTHAFTLQALSSEEEYAEAEEIINAVFGSLALVAPRPAGVSLQDTFTLSGQSPITLDPALSGDALSHGYILQIFSGLVHLDRDLNPVPDMATWGTNLEGTLYTFHLREDAVFHDGRPVTAHDFAYSFNRAAAPETQSRTARDFLGDIVGAEAVLQGKAEGISGIRVLDDYILEIEIVTPKAYFLAKMAYPTAFAVDQDTVEAGGEEWWKNPNGTGPFRLKQWNENEVLVLERNQNFYGHKPFLQNVVFRLFGDIPVRMYEKDETDATTVFLDDLDRIESRSPLRDELHTASELALWYVGFDVTQPPFDDPLVRKAFLLAVDRQKLLDTVFEGRFLLAHGLLPPGMPGHDPSLPSIPFDAEEAREFLAQSSYGSAEDLPAIVFTEAGFVTSSRFVDALIAEWRRNLGVDVQVQLIPPSQYYTNLKAARGNLFEFGWVADYPDAQNFLDFLFHSDTENNAGEYSNAEFDTLVDTAATLQDEEERWRMYRQAEQVLIDDAAFIPIRFGVNYFLVKPYVQCYAPDPQGQIDLSRVRLQRSAFQTVLTEPCH